MSWLYSRALVEEYSAATSLDGELSAPLSGNPTQLAYLPPDRMTAFSRLSRFGMTFRPLTADRGEELLTLFLEDFPVRTFPLPDEALASKEPDRECGDTWRELLARYDLNTSTWKIVRSSLLEDSIVFSGTWPKWGLMRNGELFQRQPLVRHTKGTGFGLWLMPTPTTNPEAPNHGSNSKGPHNLKEVALTGWKPGMIWPTPVKSDYAARRPTENWKGTSDLPSVVWTANGGTQNPDKPPAKLNPTWVEWLMGWPLEWTDLKPLEMDKYQQWRQQHGGS
jgi:hypothetical protein